MPQHRRHASRLIAAERRRKALALRRAGATYDQIAEALEVSVARARSYVDEAIEAINKEIGESAAEVRTIEAERLDEMMRILWPKVREGNLKAMDRVMRIMERRSRLLGLDAPQEHHHSGEVQHQLGVERADVAELERVWNDTVDADATEIPDAELVGSVETDGDSPREG